MKLVKGLYYNKVQDNLFLVRKVEEKGFWNKVKNEFFIAEVCNVVFYREDENRIVEIDNISIEHTENLIYIGKF